MVESLQPPPVAAILPQGEDMARRRLQQKGDLYRQGGWWKLRWMEDRIDGEGQLTRGWSRPAWVGPSEGAGRLTEKQARRLAWENFLSRLDGNTRTPQSVMTVEEFVKRRFLPGHVALLKQSGQDHYHWMLAHVLPTLGSMRLRDVRTEDVQRFLAEMLAQKYSITQGKKGEKTTIAHPYSVQTVKHLRNVISAIFTYAEAIEWHPGPNPARRVKLPEMVRRPAHALTFEQAQVVLATLRPPETDMALAMILTSLNVAELCGLWWLHVNLSQDWTVVDGEGVPPMHLAVRQQWYRGRYGTLKRKARRRNIPIPALLAQRLEEIRRISKWTGPQHPVFAARNGHPIDQHNALARHVKPVGEALGMPWLSWHVFRRTHTTLADQLGASPLDRQALMGHGDLRMTALYTMTDGKRRLAVLEQMAERLLGQPRVAIQ